MVLSQLTLSVRSLGLFSEVYNKITGARPPSDRDLDHITGPHEGVVSAFTLITTGVIMLKLSQAIAHRTLSF